MSTHGKGVGCGGSQRAALLELGLTPVATPQLSCEVERIGRRRVVLRCTRPAMGTLVHLTLIHSSLAGAEEAVGRLFEEIDRLVGVLSRHDGASALACLNRAGYLDGSPPELCDLVRRAVHYNGISNGAFDITVKPLLDLFEREPNPARGDLAAALELTGCGRISMAKDTIRLGRQGMGVTLDGIAKGFIVDRAAQVLRRHRIRRFLINAGGDIRAAGKREDGRAWTVAVQSPAKDGSFPDVVGLSNAALATSGGYEQYYDPSMQHHHIIDSGMGSSPRDNASVTVLAPSTMVADALATTLVILPWQRGLELLSTLPGCEALVVTSNGQLRTTKRWPGRVDEYKSGTIR